MQITRRLFGYALFATCGFAIVMAFADSAIVITYLNSLFISLVVAFFFFSSKNLSHSIRALWRGEAQRDDVQVASFHGVTLVFVGQRILSVYAIATKALLPSSTVATPLAWLMWFGCVFYALMFWSGSIDPQGRPRNRLFFVGILVFGLALGVGLQHLQDRGIALWTQGAMQEYRVSPALAAMLGSEFRPQQSE